MSQVTTAPVYTGNNVFVQIGNNIVGFVETLSITRNLNRRPVYGVGSPLFIDAPVTQASVTVTATNLVPLQGKETSAQSLAQQGIAPSGTLANQLYANGEDIVILDQIGGTPAYHVQDAYYNQDAVQVPGTDVLTYNLSWVARDTAQWT